MNQNIEVSGENAYSRLLWWEITNFMSIGHARCEFDERNIINIKGYNDSGKSNALRALDVCLNDRYPSNQSSFIKDDETYFRIMVGFEDGVVLLKDKYSNGQGLYEMYKDNQVIYSTKEGGALTRINGVPQAIQDYLGMTNSEDFFVNSRSCFEKQLIVQTSGSENYRFLNEILHSEEISRASILLNSDKNELMSEKTRLEMELEVKRQSIRGAMNITQDLVDSLKSRDKILDLCSDRASSLVRMEGIQEKSSKVLEFPTLDTIDMSRMELLESISQASTGLVIEVSPILPSVNMDRVNLIVRLGEISSKLGSLKDLPTLTMLDCDKLTILERLELALEGIQERTSMQEKIDFSMASWVTELDTASKALSDIGYKLVNCPNCGTSVEVEEATLCDC